MVEFFVMVPVNVVVDNLAFAFVCTVNGEVSVPAYVAVTLFPETDDTVNTPLPTLFTLPTLKVFVATRLWPGIVNVALVALRKVAAVIAQEAFEFATWKASLLRIWRIGVAEMLNLLSE